MNHSYRVSLAFSKTIVCVVTPVTHALTHFLLVHHLFDCSIQHHDERPIITVYVSVHMTESSCRVFALLFPF